MRMEAGAKETYKLKSLIAILLIIPGHAHAKVPTVATLGDPESSPEKALIVDQSIFSHDTFFVRTDASNGGV